MSRLSRSIGLSQPGVKKWISVLQASYLIYLLQPYHKNFGKRLVKRPKMYFIDPAIAAYLTRQPSAEALWRGSMGGAFFEGLIILDALKEISFSGSAAAIYFWRSQDGLEVDMIIEANGRLFPIEIKQTATPTSYHAQGMQRFRKTAGQNCEPGVIVCTTAQRLAMPFGVAAIPWQEFHGWLEEQGIVAAV